MAPRHRLGAVALKASPSVVTISVVGRQGSGTGSGVIISEDGYVVTNNHVVAAGAGADITVRLNDGRVVDAAVVGTDPTSDLAVIQLEDASGLTPAEWGDSSSLEVGDVVVAIGSPLGLDGTLTSGVVSTISRPVRTGNDASSEAVIDAIQHGPINPGNSGGALLDSQGRLVGINSAIATVGGQQSGNIGVGFAIPSDTARNVAEQIIEQGYAERAYLGVSTSAAENGAQVREVVAGGPAEGAGLQVGDVITQVGERARRRRRAHRRVTKPPRRRVDVTTCACQSTPFRSARGGAALVSSQYSAGLHSGPRIGSPLVGGAASPGCPSRSRAVLR